MPKYGVLDVESTIFQKGNPFAEKNKLCLVGIRIENKNHIFLVEYGEAPYSETLGTIATLLASCDTIVGFNCKFDLNWLARYGIFLPDGTRTFDCQLAEFILDYQRTPYPSLNMCLSKYNLGQKLDVVDRDYWSKGVDTDQIPLEILQPYLETDLEKTDELYQTLVELVFQRGCGALVNLHMQDLRVLQEMEYNGLCFDWANMGQAASTAEEELNEINRTILQFVPTEVQTHFNTGSGDHLSLLLYGGLFHTSIGTEYQHTYKAGAKAGQTATRYRWSDFRFEFPRLIDPPEGSELKKEGFYSVDEETLLQLKQPRVLVKALLRRSELEKLLGTYYKGIPALRDKYDWQDGYIHGTFNQATVITGRLSSSKPNLQNLPSQLNQYIVSRYV